MENIRLKGKVASLPSPIKGDKSRHSYRVVVDSTSAEDAITKCQAAITGGETAKNKDGGDLTLPLAKDSQGKIGVFVFTGSRSYLPAGMKKGDEVEVSITIVNKYFSIAAFPVGEAAERNDARKENISEKQRSIDETSDTLSSAYGLKGDLHKAFHLAAGGLGNVKDIAAVIKLLKEDSKTPSLAEAFVEE